MHIYQLHDILPVNFDKGAVKLKYHEFAVDSEVHCTETDATKFWLTVCHMKSPMGVHKYRYLAIYHCHVITLYSCIQYGL